MGSACTSEYPLHFYRTLKGIGNFPRATAMGSVTGLFSLPQAAVAGLGAPLSVVIIGAPDRSSMERSDKQRRK